MEIVSAILYQLTRNLTPEQIKAQGFDTYFVDHTTGVYPQAASGMPFSTATLQVTGDALADLFEDLAAEQKARLTYDNILRLAADCPEVKDPIKFLREREVVHFQRFGEANLANLSRFLMDSPRLRRVRVYFIQHDLWNKKQQIILDRIIIYSIISYRELI